MVFIKVDIIAPSNLKIEIWRFYLRDSIIILIVFWLNIYSKETDIVNILIFYL
jgi:hypothetical protein